MKWRTIFYLSIAFAAFSCEETSKPDSSHDGNEDMSAGKFIATAEWQKVKKGQPLPAGLHYRMNINTGETEVKLLDPEEPSKSEDHKTGLVTLPKEESDNNSEDTLYMSKEELKRVLAEFTPDDETHKGDNSGGKVQQEVRKKYRSYEELKKEFGSLNITVKTDMEILKDLVTKGKQQIISNDEEGTVTTLKDVEYLVHQIDNAREFVRLGGLNDVVIPAINSTSPKVRAESLWLVGSAAQSNPKVQIAVLNAGIMQKLVKAAVLDSDETVQARAIYALSCLTRQFPAAQSKLVNEGGLSTLKTILDSERFSDLKTKMRVITLINDLMLERAYVQRAIEDIEHLDFSSESEAAQKIQQHKKGELKEKLRQYNAISLEKRLLEDGWCQRLSEFLWKLHKSGTNSGRTHRRDDLGSVVSKDVPYRPEHDAVEKVTGTLVVMKNICLEEFQNDPKLVKVLQEFLSWYQDLSIREEMLQKQSLAKCNDLDNCHLNEDSGSVIDDGDWYYTTIAKMLKELLDLLRNNNSSANYGKDEL